MTRWRSAMRVHLAHMQSFQRQYRLWPFSADTTPWLRQRAHLGVRGYFSAARSSSGGARSRLPATLTGSVAAAAAAAAATELGGTGGGAAGTLGSSDRSSILASPPRKSDSPPHRLPWLPPKRAGAGGSPPTHTPAARPDAGRLPAP